MDTGTLHRSLITELNIRAIRKLVCLSSLSLFTVAGTSAQSGSSDPSFTIGTGANNRVFGMAMQPDGKQLLVGAFTTYNGVAQNRIVRIGRNGGLDATFSIGSGANAQASCVAVDPVGKVLIGGSFSSFNGVFRNKMIRLTSTGALDPTFVMGAGFSGGNVNSILVQSNGQIIVVGTFTQYNGSGAGRLVRLNNDGSLDATYAIGTGANGDIYSASLDDQGRLVVVGSFTSVNGTTRAGIARVNADGTVDTAFIPGTGVNGAPFVVAHQRDGKILIGGLFTTYNGTTANRIARIMPNGAIDASFTTGTGFNSWVYTFALQGDGKILAGGDFATYNGATRGRLVRLNPNGTLDASFVTGSTFNNWVYAVTWQPEGKVTVAGGFTLFNGGAKNRVIRLQTGCDDTIALTLTTDGSGAQTSWELVGEGVTYPLCSGSGYSNNSTATATCCVPNSCIRLRVLDSAGDGMSTGGYVLRDQAGNRIIDDSNDGVFASESSLANAERFCLPLSPDRVIVSNCDKMNFVPNDFMIASPVAAVSAQWGVGDQTDDGYEFWFFDPDGSYSQRKFRNHATTGGYGGGALRACYQRLSWFPNVDQIPTNKVMNVRIRGRVNGVNNAWGPACRFKVLPAPEICPVTKLLDIPGHQFFSCGVTRARTGFVVAQPVSGATNYQFEFRNLEGSYYYVIQGTTYVRTLYWSTPSLIPGQTYRVRVRASRNNGSTWCPWGAECLVTIAPNVAPEGGSSNFDAPVAEQRLSIWPNPNNGSNLEVNIQGLDRNAVDGQVVVYDATGKLVYQDQFAVEAPIWRSTISFEGTLPQGTYLLRVVSGEKYWNERFVVAQ